MNKKSNSNYSGAAASFLRKHKIESWDRVKIQTTKGSFNGTILPRGNQGDDQHIVLKLSNGYNIGIRITGIKAIVLLEKQGVKQKPTTLQTKQSSLPIVTLLGTGGTIAAKVDYQTGAVVPLVSAQEIVSTIPEIQEICNIETSTLFQTLGENINPKHWIKIATKIGQLLEDSDPKGIVIMHGTDTMSFTAAALAFMLRELDRPVILTGSQKSSDRPSSDATSNLLCSLYGAAYSDIAEVMVCMHANSSDGTNFFHRGTRVRKMHSSRRDAFRSIGLKPLASMSDRTILPSSIKYRRRQATKTTEIDAVVNERVGLLYSYPGLRAEVIDFFTDKKYQALIIAGTGLGHTNQELIGALTRAQEEGLFVFMTTQCLWGHARLTIYETGRLLKKAGVLSLGNMLPEVALVKAMWVLGHRTEQTYVREMMLKNIAGEITDRETVSSYQVLQGI